MGEKMRKGQFTLDAYLVKSVSRHPKAPSPLCREAARCYCCSVFRSAGAVQNDIALLRLCKTHSVRWSLFARCKTSA
jgi:hypothetical protein